MGRPFAELIHEVEENPDDWEVVKTEVLPSLNRRNRGGASVQELLRHKTTGEELVRHSLLKADGSLFAESHFRPNWKGTP